MKIYTQEEMTVIVQSADVCKESIPAHTDWTLSEEQDHEHHKSVVFSHDGLSLEVVFPKHDDDDTFVLLIDTKEGTLLPLTTVVCPEAAQMLLDTIDHDYILVDC